MDLRLSINRDAKRVHVAVSNAVTPDQAKVLRERIATIASQRDPLEGYLAAMHENPDGRGGIGLSRVRFEAALELEGTHDDGLVTVHAHGPLAPPPQAFIPLRGRASDVASA